MTLTNSTISGNSAVSGGGGIYTNSGTLTLTNSTVSGNTGERRRWDKQLRHDESVQQYRRPKRQHQ